MLPTDILTTSVLSGTLFIGFQHRSMRRSLLSVMLDKSLADADTDFQPDFRVMDPLSHEIVQVSKHFSVELVR